MEKYLKSALSLVQAEKRAELFNKANQNNISYNLFLKLKKGDIFEGLVTVHFDLSKVSKDFFLEFAGTTISEIVINGTNVPTTDQYESLRDKRFLNLPESYLKEGKNEVKVKYSSIYANDGLGLHSFVDTDGKQYIYSQCEAYAANKILPCFDQPDLKATLTLTMAYPKEWLAVANQPACEESTKKINKNTYLTAEEQQEYTITAYLTTPRLPTYLYAFIAGPYIEIKSENVYNKITMSCFCRESLVPHLKNQAEEIFDITRESIKFYESYFNYPYPFLKYDSIFCPEYKFGAMENPGAVTFNDRYLWREKVTQDRNTMRANTIAHEAAHHWFGDLVTMKWWNDLWLNESFADYISHYCLYNIRDKVTTTKFSDIWLTFFDEKGWGYDTDQQKTTHPIAGDVMNTDQAESIFDGITYSKGAATLKQLMSLIGEANFGKAMGSYFKTYEWSNATLSEFIGKLQDYYLPTIQGSPENLESWKAEWLQTAGLNECKAVFNPEDTSAQAKLVIKQGFALEEFATLRHHKMKVAFFGKNGKVCEEKDILLANTAETTITYDGSKQPQAVILNYQDQAFIKIRLDDHSAAFLKEHMNAIPDQLTRAMIWRSLFDMVRDGQFSAAKFVQAAIEAIPKESSDSALNNILGFVSESLDFSPNVLNDNVLKPKLFSTILEQLLGTEKSNTNRTVLLRENLIRFASFGEKRNVDNVARLIDWFEGKDSQLKDFHLEIKDRWSIVNIIHKYPRLTDAKKNAYFNQVADLDSSDRMKLAEQKCEAMRAGHSLRKKLFESYLDPENKLSVQMVEQSMLGYSTSLRAAHTDEVLFFDHLVNIFQTRNNEYAQAYYYGLFPHKENFTYYSQRIQELLGQATDNDWLQKCLKDSLDHIERKRKGYLCSAPDVMKEFFDISF